MQLVKEHIKFERGLDPKKAMNVGLINIIEDFVQKVPRLWRGGYVKEEFLWVCCMEGKFNYVKYLIENGWDIHYLDDLALQWAVRNGHYQIVKLLLNKGANVHANKEYALQWTIESEKKNKQEKYIKILELLIKAGADIHFKNEYALQEAIQKNQTKMVKILLDNGASINKIKYTLQWAAFNGNKNIVQLLLNAKINVDNAILQSAISTTKNKNVIKLLKDYTKKLQIKLVKEHINFERGLDPKDAMNIGKYAMDQKIIDAIKQIPVEDSWIKYFSKTKYREHSYIKILIPLYYLQRDLVAEEIIEVIQNIKAPNIASVYKNNDGDVVIKLKK